MPELPEVETVRIGLSRLLPGHKVTAVDSDWHKSFPNTKSDVDNFLIGAHVKDIRRRAKVLTIDLDTDYSLVVHLKMTGQMVYVAEPHKEEKGEREKVKEQRFGAGHPNDSLIGILPDKSTRIILTFESTDFKKVAGLEVDARKKRSTEQDVHKVRRASTAVSDKVAAQERWQSFGLGPKYGAPGEFIHRGENAGQRGPQLFFNDQRKFGWMRLIPTVAVEELDFFKKVGPEPLESNFTVLAFTQRLMRRKNSNIKAVLLDQTVIAGVGNIYTDESLWGAKIHPSTLVKDITNQQFKTLFTELQYVLNLAIEKGGSTDKNYVNAEGKKGSYMDFARVFRRENLPCPRCGTTIQKTRVAARGTHTCPNCQTDRTL